SVFYVSAALANVPSGMAADVTGRRVLIQALALLGGALALAGFGLVPGGTAAPLALAVAVAVMGATNMLWHPAAISYLSLVYPARKGFALSIHALGANLGDAVAPLAAGAVLMVVRWPETAYVNALPAILMAGILVVALGRARGGDAHHVRVGDAREYLRGMAALLKRRAVWLLCFLAGFRTATQNGLLVFLPLYLTHDLKASPVAMGFAMTMLQVGGMIAAPLAGLWSDRAGRRPVVLAGLGATTLIVFALTFVDSLPLYVAGVSVLGFCMYALRPVIHGWMMDMAPKELGGSVTSLVFGTQSGLATLIPVIGGALADRFGLVAVFYFLAGTVLFANVLTLLVPKEERA
ncbi:MAG: MFS transporter, partial [Pseudomonadota bacterium]